MEPKYKISEDSQIVVTKSVGLSGTMKLYSIFKEELHSRYQTRFLEPVSNYADRLLYNKEYEVLKDFRWELLVEASYGGIFNALFNLGYETGLGVVVDMKALPITQATIEISEYASVNPYQLHSAGSMVIAATNGVKLADCLNQVGVDASVVGYMTKDKARIVRAHEGERFLVPVRQDELTKLIDEKEVKKEYPKTLVIKAFQEK
ncbi:MAG: hypothetical protein K5656_07010 [Lachnospiraceae bacterium]|nr:hypothetical protein [Lachnospiraceae bacterium]